MTALAANSPLSLCVGDIGGVPAAASQTFYEGAMVGENGSGYGRPLTAGDKFRGHSINYVQSSTVAGAYNVQVYRGRYRLVVPLVIAITDANVRRKVYASDDATYTLIAKTNSYVGRVVRYVDATHAEVEFQTEDDHRLLAVDVAETKSDDYTVDAEDMGKIIYVDTDAKTITLPAMAAGFAGFEITFVNAGADGAVLLQISPNASDKIMGADQAGTDNKDYRNTKATAKSGDFVTLRGDGTNGWWIVAKRGTWVSE